MTWSTAFRRTGSGVIPGLDGLRAIAVLCVIYGHLLWSPSFPGGALVKVLNPAGLGVRLFFVISGFLITSILLSERRRSGSIALGQFYYRRTLRIFPAYYAFLAVVFALAVAGVIRLDRSDYWHTLTYTFNLKGAQDTWWVGHTWSLAVEEQFYLLWPLVLRSASPRTALKGAVAAFLLAPVGRGLLLAASPEAYARWSLALPLVADPLAIGAVLAFLADRREWRAPLQALLERPLWIPAAATVLLIESLDHRPNFFPYPIVYQVVLQPIATLALAVIVGTFALTQNAAGRVLSARPLVAIGVASYSLYLWQMLFISPMEPSYFRFPLNLVWLTLAAGVSYLCIEVPFNRLRARVTKTPQVGSLGQSPATAS